MRLRIVLWTVVLLFASSPAQAQYGAMPTQSFMQPTNPARFGQIDFGDRFSSIDGDEARFQRFRDLRDGPFFDLTGLHGETDTLLLDASARNVGWKDQRYWFELQRPGTFRVRALYDQIPTFISVDTRTPYDPLPDDDGLGSTTVTLPDALQAAIQANPAANFRPLIEAAADDRFFESRIRRDFLGFDVRYTHADIDATVTYANTAKEGDIPFGAYLQIPIEVPLPIDSRTNDVRTSIEWANAKGMVRAGWDASWYNQQAPSLIWDNPQRAVDSASAGAQGRLVAWPSNNMLSFNVGGAYRMPSHTTLNGVFAFGRWNQDEPLVPFTINSVNAAAVPLPRASAEAQANTTSVVLNFVTQPYRYLDFSARYRLYDFDNRTPEFVLARPAGLPDRVVADGATGVWSDPTIGKVGPEALGYVRNYVDLDAGILGVANTTFRVGYSRYSADTHHRVYEHVDEDTFRVGADIVGNQYGSLRSTYEHAARRGDDLNPLALEFAEESSGMRHFDIGSRDRDRLTVLANLTPAASIGINGSIAWTKDDYLNEETREVDRFGLQEYTSRTYTAGVDVTPRDTIGAGLSFSIEDYDGVQQSRTASPGLTPPQETDPRRNWTLDEGNKAWSLIGNVDVLGAIEKTELRLIYNYTNYTGTYGFRLPANTTLSTPVPLPDIRSTEARLTTDLRYFLTRNVAVGVVYWYDSYDVSDFSFSPDVVSGVAQPAVEEGQNATVNALLLNYFYRPFKAHTAWLRLTYVW